MRQHQKRSNGRIQKLSLKSRTEQSSSSRSTTTRRDIHTLLLNVYEERLHNFPAIDFPERSSRLDYLFIAGEYIVEFVGNFSRSQDNNSTEANSH